MVLDDLRRLRFFDVDKPLRDYTEAEWQQFLHGPKSKVKLTQFTLTYEGLVECAAMQVSDLATFIAGIEAEGVAPLLGTFGMHSTTWSASGWAIST